MASTVRDYMTADPVTVMPDTEITHAVGTMIEHDISGVLVVDAGNRLVGILTERDCIAAASAAHYYDEWGGPVSQFMTTPVETVGPDESLVDVAARLAQSSFRRLPVVESDRVIGLLSRRDVLRALGQGPRFSPR